MRIERSTTLSKLDGKLATFELDGGATIAIPKDELSPGAQVGDAYTLTLIPVQQAALEREELARTLLNEILHNDRIEG